MTDPPAIGFGRPDRLFELLPLILRQLDADRGNPLRDLLRVLGEQVAVVEDGITQLGEEPFIETCSDASVPYLAELVGWIPVADAGLPALGTSGRDLARDAVLVPRRDVANTIRHRRRKGTLALLEELARDVSGWPARAVEFYRLLGYAQHADHVHLNRGRTVDVRQQDVLDRLGGPFEQTAHVVDVRRADTALRPGRYNVPSVGVYAWRLGSYSMTKAPAAQAEHAEGQHSYTFDSLYHDLPLFVGPASPSPVHPSSAADVPSPLTRRLLEHRDQVGAPGQPMASPIFYGEDKSLMIWAHDWPSPGTTTPIPADRVRPADLSDWHRYRVRADTVAVDPELGRMLFRPNQAPSNVTVSYHYGFPAALGGGEYHRPIAAQPARSVVRFKADHLTNPTTLVVEIRGGGPEADVIRGHWPPEGLARLDGYDPARPPGPGLIGDLLDALNATIGDPAFYDARPRETPTPTGDALLLQNRRLIEERFPDTLAHAWFSASVATTEELATAVENWRAAAARHSIIELTATAVYTIPLELELAEGQELVIRAANRKRPIVWLSDRRPDRADSLAATLADGSRLLLDGLTLAGRAMRLTGAEAHADETPPDGDRAPQSDTSCGAARVVIRHCTLVPGWIPSHDCDPPPPPPPSLELLDLDGVTVEISHSILGTISVTAGPGNPVLLRLSDSILDATDDDHDAIGGPGGRVPGVMLTAVRSTIRGAVMVHAVDLVENAILTGEIAVARRRTGCVRFSWIEPGSHTPRRFHCQPDLAVARLGTTPPPDAVAREQARVRPRFTSTEYGQPGYFQLAAQIPSELWRGADDESEIGVYHDLYQPQRHANLEARLREYTPAGMQPALVLVT